MKKVGIVTFHRSKSYGATLQALATLMIVKKLGYDAEFIDYTNAYEQKKCKIIVDSLGSLKKYMRWKMKSFLLRDDHWSALAFGKTVEYYNGCISKKKYTNIKQMMSLNYDTLLVGSDQVWNPKITNGIDAVYLLGFGNTSKRVSYASSMGNHIILEDETDIYRNYLKMFTSISVRESFAKEEINRHLEKPIQIVVDPTMLVSREEWTAFADSQPNKFVKHMNEKFILSFFVGGSTEDYFDELKKIKNVLGLPLYNIQINEYCRKLVDMSLAGVTCAEFIQLIRNAQYIVTDSCHGTVFSILYGKQFAALSNRANPIRVRELLTSLQLETRLDSPDNATDIIDYHKLYLLLERFREESLQWLVDALN